MRERKQFRIAYGSYSTGIRWVALDGRVVAQSAGPAAELWMRTQHTRRRPPARYGRSR